MSNFEAIFNRSSQSAFFKTHSNVSPQLKPLLQSFYKAMVGRPSDVAAIKNSVINILSFLVSSEGKTSANYWTVDLFICLNDDWDNDWPDMSDELRAIIADMGIGLHDTGEHSEIAGNFESLPEQLLARAKGLEK